jgi:hypothetical protein
MGAKAISSDGDKTLTPKVRRRREDEEMNIDQLQKDFIL